MKKVLLPFLAALLMLFCCASASADFTLPKDLKTIGDEAFAGVQTGDYLTIPEGVETIGARAFSGASCLVVSLPNSLQSLAPDAFGDVTFDVLPGSWAAAWCRENKREFSTVKLNLNMETVEVYFGGVGRNAGALALVDSTGREENMLLEELAAELGKVRGTVIVWFASCGSGAAIYEEGVPQNGDPDFDPGALQTAVVEAFAAWDAAAESEDAPADGLAAGETAAFQTGEFRREGKFYVLTTARYQQEGWGDENEKYSYFIKYLCEGLESENGFLRADADRDGKVTQHELFLHIKRCEDDPSHTVVQNVQEFPRNSDYVLFVN